jgi:hypothetical protein
MEKTVSTTYYGRVTVTSSIQHANLIFSAHEYIVVFGLSGSAIFLHITQNRHNIRNTIAKHNMFVLILFVT